VVTLKREALLLELLKDFGFRLPYLSCGIVLAGRQVH